MVNFKYHSFYHLKSFSSLEILIVEQYLLLGCNGVQPGRSPQMSQRNILLPSSRLKSSPSNCFILVSCLTYSLTLRVEVVSSSQMLVDFYWTIWHYIQKDCMFNFSFVVTNKQKLTWRNFMWNYTDMILWGQRHTSTIRYRIQMRYMVIDPWKICHFC